MRIRHKGLGKICLHVMKYISCAVVNLQRGAPLCMMYATLNEFKNNYVLLIIIYAKA